MLRAAVFWRIFDDVLVTTHVVTGRLMEEMNLSKWTTLTIQKSLIVYLIFKFTYPWVVLTDTVVLGGVWIGVVRIMGLDSLPLGTDMLATAAVPKKVK